MRKSDYFDIAKSLFEEIQSDFSSLRMYIEENPKYVDLSMDIPKQHGLNFEINLNLQTDELFISTDVINCSWFPMKDAQVCDMFIDAVKGLIKGEYRILQLARKGEVYKAYLQKSINGNWETVCTENRKAHFPWRELEKWEIRNSLPNNA